MTNKDVDMSGEAATTLPDRTLPGGTTKEARETPKARGKTSGAGSGVSRPKCTYCGKWGHRPEQCWHKPVAPAIVNYITMVAGATVSIAGPGVTANRVKKTRRGGKKKKALGGSTKEEKVGEDGSGGRPEDV